MILQPLVGCNNGHALFLSSFFWSLNCKVKLAEVSQYYVIIVHPVRLFRLHYYYGMCVPEEDPSHIKFRFIPHIYLHGYLHDICHQHSKHTHTHPPVTSISYNALTKHCKHSTHNLYINYILSNYYIY